VGGAFKGGTMNLQELRDRIKELLNQDRENCPRCEGNGRLYADGKSHYYSENVPTVLCPHCGGSGKIFIELDADSILALVQPAIDELEKKVGYWQEKCFNDTMSAKKSGWDDATIHWKSKIDEAVKAGRKEVVAWIDSQKENGKILILTKEVWESKLKEWGLDDENN
jgi:excinuclease UvrABC ATPase subunit